MHRDIPQKDYALTHIQQSLIALGVTYENQRAADTDTLQLKTGMDA